MGREKYGEGKEKLNHPKYTIWAAKHGGHPCTAAGSTETLMFTDDVTADESNRMNIYIKMY